MIVGLIEKLISSQYLKEVRKFVKDYMGGWVEHSRQSKGLETEASPVCSENSKVAGMECSEPEGV